MSSNPYPRKLITLIRFFLVIAVIVDPPVADDAFCESIYYVLHISSRIL